MLDPRPVQSNTSEFSAKTAKEFAFWVLEKDKVKDTWTENDVHKLHCCATMIRAYFKRISESDLSEVILELAIKFYKKYS